MEVVVGLLLIVGLGDGYYGGPFRVGVKGVHKY